MSTDSVNADNPKIWPVCPTHDVTWVLRRCLSWTEGRKWVWQSDCKKSCRATPVLHNADGPVES